MSYNKRNYTNTGESLTHEDFNRIEQGIFDNDVEITNMKNPDKEGSLAKQIAENAEQINVLTEEIADITILNDRIYDFTKPTVTKSKHRLTINGCLNVEENVPSGTVVMQLPEGFRPSENNHIFLNSWNAELPFIARFWVTTDGNIALFGLDNTPACTIDFSKVINI